MTRFSLSSKTTLSVCGLFAHGNLWYRVRDSNPRHSPCKRVVLAAELTRRRTVGPGPGALRRHHNDVRLEGRVGVEPTNTEVAIRRLTTWPPARLAGRQRIELCPPVLETSSATRARPVRNKTRTESPEWADDVKRRSHDLFQWSARDSNPAVSLLAKEVTTPSSPAPQKMGTRLPDRKTC